MKVAYLPGDSLTESCAGTDRMLSTECQSIHSSFRLQSRSILSSLERIFLCAVVWWIVPERFPKRRRRGGPIGAAAKRASGVGKRAVSAMSGVEALLEFWRTLWGWRVSAASWSWEQQTFLKKNGGVGNERSFSGIMDTPDFVRSVEPQIPKYHQNYVKRLVQKSSHGLSAGA
jgi:hypothetical protein